MKKNFVKKLALVMALTLAVGSVPATNAAAAENPAFKSTTTAENRKTLKVGQTKKYGTKNNSAWSLNKVKVGNSKVATVKVSKKGKFIKVTGVSAGKTQVRAYFKNYKTKKIYKNAVLHVAVVEEKEQVSSVPEITEFTASKVNELTVTFASSVNTDDVTLAVTRGASKVDIAAPVWNADKTVATIATTAKMGKGTYTLTATAASDGVVKTAETNIVDEYVAEIKILNKTALTGRTNDADPTTEAMKAFIYYDVFNQYGDSIRTSTTINWTVSSANYTVNKATGQITVKRTDSKAYTYGESIYVTGVYAKTGVSVSETLTVAGAQAVDTIEMAGFVSKTDKTKILTTLPSDFAKDTYFLVYRTFDQNGNEMSAAMGNVKTNSVLTFVSDNILLLTSDFDDTGLSIVTIDGVEYAQVAVQPGQYVDKGGEVNITAISNKTGTKTVKNFAIGDNGLLRSFTLNAPSEVIADGDKRVEIPYVAYDMNGNQVTNYETIVRSTNTLNLTASEGIVRVEEADDGTAVVYFSDKNIGYNESTAYDEVDRTVAITTVVVGGESDNLLLSISDKRRPVAIKEATLKTGLTTVVVEGDYGTLDLTSFTYLDQYGETMKPAAGAAFFEATANLPNGFDGYYYAVKVEGNKVGGNFGIKSTGNLIVPATAGAISSAAISAGVSTSAIASTSAAVSALAWNTGAYNDKNEMVNTETLKFSIANIKKADLSETTVANAENFDYCSSVKNVQYSVIDIEKVGNPSIAALNKQYVETGLSGYATGAEAGIEASDLATTFSSISGVSVSPVLTKYQQTLKVTGTYNGVETVVPASYVTYGSNKLEISGNKITGVSGTAITGGELYDATKANFTRKDGTADVYASIVASGNAIAAPTTSVKFSDAASVPTTITTCGDSCVVNATNLLISGGALTDHNPAVAAKGIYANTMSPFVTDQYGVDITADVLASAKYTISDLKENSGQFAHVADSLRVVNNSSNSTQVDGAELGDTFVLTYTFTKNGVSASKSINLTVGSDTNAYIANGNMADETLRENYLGYDR